jgi:hypothetical protein
VLPPFNQFLVSSSYFDDWSHLDISFSFDWVMGWWLLVLLFPFDFNMVLSSCVPYGIFIEISSGGARPPAVFGPALYFSTQQLARARWRWSGIGDETERGISAGERVGWVWLRQLALA